MDPANFLAVDSDDEDNFQVRDQRQDNYRLNLNADLFEPAQGDDDDVLHVAAKARDLRHVIQQKDGKRLSAKKARSERFQYGTDDLVIPGSFGFQSVRKPTKKLTSEQLLIKNLVQASGGIDQERRQHGENMKALLRSNSTILKNVPFEFAVENVYDPVTRQMKAQPISGNLTDHLLANAETDVELYERLNETEMTNEALQALVKQNFAIVKKSDPSKLGPNCIRGNMHCASAQLLVFDVVWRVLEEIWPNINHLVPTGATRILGATRDLHEQIVSMNHILLTHEDDAAYKQFVAQLSKSLPLKRSKTFRSNAFGVNSIVERMTLKTTNKRKFREVSQKPSTTNPTKKRKPNLPNTTGFF